MAGGQISPSPIDFHRRPYNTLALPCERVINVVAFFCAYNVWIIFFVFAVLKQWLLQQSETEASFVYMIISMGADPCLLSHSLPSLVFPATFYNPFPAVKQPLL